MSLFSTSKWYMCFVTERRCGGEKSPTVQFGDTSWPLTETPNAITDDVRSRDADVSLPGSS